MFDMVLNSLLIYIEYMENIYILTHTFGINKGYLLTTEAKLSNATLQYFVFPNKTFEFLQE